MLISAENLHFGYQGTPLLKNIRFTLSEGDRVGLIGANGEGKTTLIKLILGQLDPESGSIFKKSGIRIGYLAQTGGYDSENTVYGEMREVFAEDERAISALRDVEQKIAQTSETAPEYKALAAKYDALGKLIAARDSYHFDVKIRTVLGGMGFADVYEQKISTMSGGEKTRLKLARLLLEEPDLLILDEPTNHLDVKTLFWLEEYLSAYKGAILTVSHDRYFLDKIVKGIYEIERGELTKYSGNYTKYKTLKAERVAHVLKEYEKQQEEIAHLKDFVARNLVRASTAKSALDRVKKLERLETIEKPALPPDPPRFCFSYAEKPYERVLEISGLNLTAGEKLLIKNAAFTLMRGEKCAVVGDNGTGKSTLIKQIVAGGRDEIKTGRFVRVAYYDQENANLNPDNSVLAELWERHVLWDQTKVRSTLAAAGLGAEDVEKKVSSLSGGERAKLALAVFECEGGNFLILDEPTNHLDLPARESLEDAVKAFDGTVLFVSHDRYFIEAIADKILELGDMTAKEFKGGYAEYTALKAAEKKRAEDALKAAEFAQKFAKTESGHRSKEERAKETKLRLRIKEIETEIGKLEDEETALGNELSTPEVAANFALLSEKCNRLDAVKKRLDELYAEYETLI